VRRVFKDNSGSHEERVDVRQQAEQDPDRVHACRIDTFYYENPKNKSIYPEAIKSEDEEENSEQLNEKSKLAKSPLVFIKHGRRDKSYFLSNTVQIQCDMSDTDPESEPGETETETEEEEPTPTPTPIPPTPVPEPKEWIDPNIIHLNEDDAIIRLVFQQKEEAKKKNRTLFEKQRLVLKSLYDIRIKRTRKWQTSHSLREQK